MGIVKTKETEKQWWNDNTDGEDELKKPNRSKREVIVWNKRFSLITKSYDFANKSVFVGCCGTGVVEEAIFKIEPKVKKTLGLDLTPKFIELAKIRNKTNSNAEFIVGDIECLSDYILESFDVSVIIDGLHHVPNPQLVLANLKKISKDLILYEPNALNPIMRVDELKYRKQGVREDSFYSWQLKNWCKKLEYHEVKIGNFGFIPLHTSDHFLPISQKLETMIEKIPIIRSISGCLLLVARS